MAVDYGFLTPIAISGMNFSAFLSIVLNLLLLPVILLCSKKSVGPYRILLFLFTLVSAAFSFVNYVSTPMYAVNEFGWVAYGYSLSMNQEIGSWILVSYCGCHSSMILILTYCFLYRYATLCRPKLVQWFHQPRKICVLALIFAVYFFLWTGITAISLRPTPETNRILRDLIYEASGRESDTLCYIGLSSYTEIGEPIPGFIINIPMRCLMFYACTCIMIVCTVKVMKEIRSQAAVASTQSLAQRIQTRLFFLLLSQALVPILFSITPGLLSYNTVLFRIHAPYLNFYTSTLLPFSQAIEPLLTIMLVGDYRRAPIILYRKLKRIRITTTAVSSSTL